MERSVNLLVTGPVARAVEVAQAAEQVGYGRCWVYDEGLVTRDVYVTLTAIALSTSRIAVGPGITNPYTRHPGVTAGAVATLDEISGGRAFLGLGAGGGLTLGPMAMKRVRPVASVATTIAAVRGLWAGEPVSVTGPTFTLDRARLALARPDIEILLAGRGPRMVELGARAADGFYLSWLHRDTIATTVEALRTAAGAAGRDRFTVIYSTMVVTSDEDRERARAQLSFRLPDSPPEVRDRLGLDDARLGAIRAALAEGGPTAAAELVDPDWIDQFVLAGTHREVTQAIDELGRRHGIDEFQVTVTDLDRAGELIEALAPPTPAGG